MGMFQHAHNKCVNSIENMTYGQFRRIWKSICARENKSFEESKLKQLYVLALRPEDRRLIIFITGNASTGPSTL